MSLLIDLWNENELGDNLFSAKFVTGKQKCAFIFREKEGTRQDKLVESNLLNGIMPFDKFI